jgi:hypothetical protein
MARLMLEMREKKATMYISSMISAVSLFERATFPKDFAVRRD